MTCEIGSPHDVQNRRRTQWSLSLLATLVLLSGCVGGGAVIEASGSGGGERSLEVAKTEFFVVLDEIIAIVEDGEIAELRPQETTSGALFECGPADQYYWPGGRSAILADSADPEVIISRIESSFSAQPGWTVERLTERDRDVVPLRLQRDDGVFVTVSVFDQGGELDLNGFSACFTLVDYDPLDRY